MKVKILALTGDYWHPAEIINKCLQPLINEGNWEADIFDSPVLFPWEKLSSYDVLLLSQWGKIEHDQTGSQNRWMSSELEQTIEKYVKDGGSLFVLHSALSEQNEHGLYHNVVKGHFLSHPNEHQIIQVYKEQLEHRILEGIDDFSIVDEQYFVGVDSQDTSVLITGTSPLGSSPVAWAHSYGKGRVFSLTPGHTEAVLMHPMMQKLIRNGISWCIQK